jgi:hypothetical protein
MSGRLRDADGFEVPKKTFSHRFEHDDEDSDTVTVVGATNDDSIFQGEIFFKDLNLVSYFHLLFSLQVLWDELDVRVRPTLTTRLGLGTGTPRRTAEITSSFSPSSAS